MSSFSKTAMRKKEGKKHIVTHTSPLLVCGVITQCSGCNVYCCRVGYENENGLNFYRVNFRNGSFAVRAKGKFLKFSKNQQQQSEKINDWENICVIVFIIGYAYNREFPFPPEEPKIN